MITLVERNSASPLRRGDTHYLQDEFGQSKVVIVVVGVDLVTVGVVDTLGGPGWKNLAVGSRETVRRSDLKNAS